MADDSGVKDPQQLQVEGEAEEVEEPKFVQLVIKVPGQGDRLSISVRNLVYSVPVSLRGQVTEYS